MSDLGPPSALIDRLASDLKPVRPGIVPWLLFGAVGICASPSLAVVVWLWGVRPDIAAALQTTAFWAKEAFAATLALAGSAAMLRLARPDGKATGAIYVAFGAAAVMLVLAVLQLGANPPGLWSHLVVGKTAAVCPWLILLLALPIFAGAMAMMRSMAPTRLAAAGAAAGLAAGGLSALVYSLACDENTMPFVLIWYGVTVAATTLIGAILGPQVLRW
jgi:hypothetical protein